MKAEYLHETKTLSRLNQIKQIKNQNKYFICWCDKVSFRLFLFHFRIGNKNNNYKNTKQYKTD